MAFLQQSSFRTQWLFLKFLHRPIRSRFSAPVCYSLSNYFLYIKSPFILHPAFCLTTGYSRHCRCSATMTVVIKVFWRESFSRQDMQVLRMSQADNCKACPCPPMVANHWIHHSQRLREENLLSSLSLRVSNVKNCKPRPILNRHTVGPEQNQSCSVTYCRCHQCWQEMIRNWFLAAYHVACNAAGHTWKY